MTAHKPGTNTKQKKKASAFTIKAFIERLKRFYRMLLGWVAWPFSRVAALWKEQSPEMRLIMVIILVPIIISWLRLFWIMASIKDFYPINMETVMSQSIWQERFENKKKPAYRGLTFNELTGPRNNMSAIDKFITGFKFGFKESFIGGLYRLLTRPHFEPIDGYDPLDDIKERYYPFYMRYMEKFARSASPSESDYIVEQLKEYEKSRKMLYDAGVIGIIGVHFSLFLLLIIVFVLFYWINNKKFKKYNS